MKIDYLSTFINTQIPLNGKVYFRIFAIIKQKNRRCCLIIGHTVCFSNFTYNQAKSWKRRVATTLKSMNAIITPAKIFADKLDFFIF